MKTGITVVAIVTSCTAIWAAQRQSAVQEGYHLFTRVWTAKEGLGPSINARSCAGCHGVPRMGGSGTDERSLVAIVPTGPNSPSGRVFRRLRVSKTGAIDERARPVSAVLRKAPSLLGSGLLEGISHDEIAAGATELGTRGRAPQGKYGWKGHIRNLEEASAAAFANELGLSNPMFPDAAAGMPTEISQSQINAVVAFIFSLPPIKSEAALNDPSGERLFTRLGCPACHRPSFRSLRQSRAFPYTDLLLHDMGQALADGIDEGSATVAEFKTPPLWGIAKTGPPYLHDGRAETLHDAIAAHGGEAEKSAIEYGKLRPSEREAVLAFLRSL
jgi:CxxC motif-containing protein (DUF1111 family)